MRHGNISLSAALWNETSTPILPMRHGNRFWSVRTGSLEKPTSILPMRHGNWSISFLLHPGKANFDPTYEAWKLSAGLLVIKTMSILRSYLWGMETCLCLRVKNFFFDFDPTYEAWKRASFRYACFFSAYSDPTYEAWKLGYLDRWEGGRRAFQSYLRGTET